MAIIICVGFAVIPMLEVSIKPPPLQGKTLTVRCNWKGASSKVMENSVTSVLEGVISGVKGVESISSESYFGSCRIKIQLKKNADPSTVRFEISSLIRQVYPRLPEGVGFPSLSGGEIINNDDNKNERVTLLIYYVNADKAEEEIVDLLNVDFAEKLRRVDGVERVVISGKSREYLELTFDPILLNAYGISPSAISDAIRSFMGRTDVVGDVINGDSIRQTLYLTAADVNIADIPILTKNGDVVYLNNLMGQSVKKRKPNRYYRINGLNTVNLRIDVDADANLVELSNDIQEAVVDISESLPKGIWLTLASDNAEEERVEVTKLIIRSFVSLVILLLFVWIIKRNWKYLFVISISLVLNILLAVIIYWLADIKLHVFSMAGVAVSLSLIIDSTIVMTDHYGYYRNRKVFLAILAAMLTTAGAMLTVKFLPEQWQRDLYDFARVISINLVVSLIVAFLFVPTLIDSLNYNKNAKCDNIKKLRYITRWNSLYIKYVCFVQKLKWILGCLVVICFSWTLYLFVDDIEKGQGHNENERLELNIGGELPIGGTAEELNQKVVVLEEKLKSYQQIKRFTTQIDGRRVNLKVEFQDSCLNTSVPYVIEQEVISELISIGGADWNTYGVSRMGFSNSLNLQHRSNRIWIFGYNYDYVNRYAEEISKYIASKSRVRDVVVRIPDREYESDELYMEYDNERLMVYDVTASNVYSELSGILGVSELGKRKYGDGEIDVVLKSTQTDKFDHWQIKNTYIGSKGGHVKVSEVMNVGKRETKSCIPKKNQEYLLSVEFNVLGSYSYVDRLISDVIKHFNNIMPMGYRCESPYYDARSDKDAPYWIIGIVVAVVFFICAILFESLRIACVVVLMIPVSFIGIFMTFYCSDVGFGTGGLAAMVMLAGLVINSAIYIVNEYRIFQKDTVHKNKQLVILFVKAFNHKIIPILITIFSTTLGLIPFFIDGKEEPFWLSFATGVSGGLIFSIVVLVVVLPLLLNLRKKQ